MAFRVLGLLALAAVSSGMLTAQSISELFVVDGYGPTRQLYTVEFSNAATTPVHALGALGQVAGMTSDLQGIRLYDAPTTTGIAGRMWSVTEFGTQATLVGVTNLAQPLGIAHNPTSNTFFVAHRYLFLGTVLFTISASGQFMTGGTMSSSVSPLFITDLARSPNGELWAAHSDGATHSLGTIDVPTLVYSPVISLSEGTEGMCFAPTTGLLYYITNITRVLRVVDTSTLIDIPVAALTPTLPHPNSRVAGMCVASLTFANAAAQVVGTGCLASNSLTPSLITVLGQNPVLGQTLALQVQNAVPSLPMVFCLANGTQLMSSALGGNCFVHLELSSMNSYFMSGLNPLLTTLASVSGTANISLLLPSSPLFNGAVFGVQAAVIDLTAANVLTVTNALRLTLGM